MRLVLVAVGRAKSGPEHELVARYLKWAAGLSRGLGIHPLELREIETSRARDAGRRKSEEAAAIRGALEPGAKMIACDAGGKMLDSEAFAGICASSRDAGTSTLGLVIGGPDGLDPDLCGAAMLALAFGAMTWPHQLVRVMAAEQIYRAMTILAAHPYHRA